MLILLKVIITMTITLVWLARPQLPSREGRELLAPRGREVVV